jgi:epoxyqueuosine reductase
MTLASDICKKARALGFDLVGITSAFPVPHIDAYRDWLAKGYHGDMNYLARPDRVERRARPDAIVPNAHSIICAGMNYYSNPLPDEITHDPSRGLISTYAWGPEYHDLMLPMLSELAAFIHTNTDQVIETRVYVDTGPILERAYAAQAGLGFIGKNTSLIHPRMGSWLFLGEIITDADLPPTSQAPPDARCGTCRRCLDACPTGALVAPYVLDARRCISYLTIESKGAIPQEFRSLIGNHIYGCDVCQQVCPWQRFAKPKQNAPASIDHIHTAPFLKELLEIDEAEFQKRYANTPIQRIGRTRLLRNTAVALGNWADKQAVDALTSALQHPEPLIHDHALWALNHIDESTG